MKFKLLKNIANNAVLALLVGFLISFLAAEAEAAVNPFVAAGGIFLTHFAVDTALSFSGYKTAMPKMLFMAVQVEIWEKDIIDNIFKDNSFLQYAVNEDEYVLEGKVVHIPVAGSKPTVVKNRGTLPGTVVQRGDTDITYVLDEFTTDPILISNAETIELSYDKRQNVTGEHFDGLTDSAADDILIKWASSSGGASIVAPVIRTLGADVPAHSPDATGNRKKFTKESLKEAQTYMNKKGIPKAGRYALIDPDMMSQLLDDPDLKTRALIQELSLQDGTVNKLYGFILLERQTVLTYNNAATPVLKALGAATAATDNAAAFCWQMKSVGRAKGLVKFFENKGDATYYGDIYSGLLRSGGRNRRVEGILSIVQAAGS